jgi:hypothetical protein
MTTSVLDALKVALGSVPPTLLDDAAEVANRGSVQLHLPALGRRHWSKLRADDTAAEADVDATAAELDRQQLLEPQHEAVVQSLDAVDWGRLVVIALDMSGWDLRLDGWQQLLKKLSKSNVMRKLVLSDCNIRTNSPRKPKTACWCPAARAAAAASHRPAAMPYQTRTVPHSSAQLRFVSLHPYLLPCAPACS